VSPYRINRSNASEIINSPGRFAEVYVRCSLQECERRDVKGMYAKARRGEIKGFTGIDDPYEEPENPDLLIDTEHESIKESAEKIRAYLTSKGLR